MFIELKWVESPINLLCWEYLSYSKHVAVISSRVRSSKILVHSLSSYSLPAKENRSIEEWNIVVTPRSSLFLAFLQAEHPTPSRYSSPLAGRKSPKLTTSVPMMFGVSRFCRQQCFISATCSLSLDDTTRTCSPLLFVVLKSLHELRRIEINQSRWKSLFAVVVLPPADYIVAHVFQKEKKSQ